MSNGLPLGLVLVAMVAAGCHRARVPPAAAVPPGEVWITQRQVVEGHLSFTVVVEMDLPTSVSAAGRVSFDDNKVLRVFSPVTGRVVAVHAQFGDNVAKGAPLASIDSPDVGVASADMDKARAALAAARREYLREKELFEAHASAERDLEAAQSNFEKARADNERAEKMARLLRTGSIEQVTQHYVLRSLIEGEVVSRNISPGLEVQGQYSGGTSQELFTVGELDTVWVTADVFEMDLANVKSGQLVSAKVISYPEHTFEGIVDWVSGTLDPVTHTAKVRCTIANRDHLLKPEMYASTSIRVASRKTAVVPRRSVLRLGEQKVIFVDTGTAPDGRERIVRRLVSVDDEGPGDAVPVIQGVKPGERIVVDGALLLSELL